ncbi:MAG: transposase [Patescibacteria group bacterium]|nr:transposase [Patescibacteria group bacterium]
MPARKTIFVNDKYYHVFNRGIDRRITFSTKNQYLRAVETIWFYSHQKLSLKLSDFFSLGFKDRHEIRIKIFKLPKLVEIISYCLMPNHFHLLLKQKVDFGISKYMSNFQNSYTRAYNIQIKRTGPLFNNQFKAVRLDGKEQLLYVSKYIHLNPLKGYVVKNAASLLNYKWSSFNEYITNKGGFCKRDDLLTYFKNSDEYKNFVLNDDLYKKHIDSIRHLTFEL